MNRPWPALSSMGSSIATQPQSRPSHIFGQRAKAYGQLSCRYLKGPGLTRHALENKAPKFLLGRI
jgi:hypothetical protein